MPEARSSFEEPLINHGAQNREDLNQNLTQLRFFFWSEHGKRKEQLKSFSMLMSVNEKAANNLHHASHWQELGKLGAEAFPFDGAVWETGPTHCDGDDVQSTNRLTL